MKIALAQINTTVGDLPGNTERMVRMAERAVEGGAEMVVFPELSITGYPPLDLIEKASFRERSEEAVEQLAARTAALPAAIVCGYVGRPAAPAGKRATNSAAVLRGGKVVFRQNKMLLPTYDVFDEARYFAPAESQSLFALGGRNIALTICEDAWNDKHYWQQPLYRRDPVQELAQRGGNLLVSINASPYHMGKRALRREILGATARRYNLPLVYVNQVGGNDQLVFDGSSFAMDAAGNVVASAASFAEDLVFFDTEALAGDLHENLRDECEAVYEALVLGTRDYIHKCGFGRVLIGLSGGIDSSLTAAIAVDALGPENVIGVGMPGPFSSEGSVKDAADMAAQSRHPLRARPHHADVRDVPRGARPAVCRCAARRDGREPPGAAARRDADGALEQMVRPGAHHRQQERAGGGLLHAVRRYVRRAGGDQRRAQDAGLRAFARGQPPPQRTPSRKASSTSRLRPSCGRTRRTAIRFRRTRSSTRSSAATWRSTARRSRSRRN